MSTNVTAPTEEERQRENTAQRFKKRRLESALASTFIAQQKERVPAERSRLWAECLRLVDEIEKLGAENAKHTDEPG